MRYIPVQSLKPGKVLGSDLLHNDRVLLRRDLTLSESHLDRIRTLGFQGVYVADDLSREIRLHPLVLPDNRQRAQKAIGALFREVETDETKKSYAAVPGLRPLLRPIMEDVLDNGQAMFNTIDIRSYEDYDYAHSVNVTVLSISIGTMLGIKGKDLDDLALCALVHDIGKASVNNRIMNKQSELSFTEFEEVKRHSLAGYNFLDNVPNLPATIKNGVLSHHEQYDGTGYPFGLSGSEIPVFSRILFAADVFDSLTSERPYRHAMLPNDAVEYIVSGYNTMFDPMVVDAFKRKVAPYPEGFCVRLNTGEQAIVLHNYTSDPRRPAVRIIENGKATDRVIDLTEDYGASEIGIVKVIQVP